MKNSHHRGWVIVVCLLILAAVVLGVNVVCLNRDLAALTRAHSTLLHANQITERERDEGLVQIHTLTEEKELLTIARAGLEADLSAVTEEKDQLTEANAVLTEAKAGLEANLSAVTEEKDQLTEANAVLAEAKAGLEANLSAVTEEKDQLTEANAVLAEAKAELQADLDAMTKEKNALAEAKEELEADLFAMTKEKDDFSMANAALTEAKEGLEAALSAMTEETDTLAVANAALTEAKAGLETALSAMTEENDHLSSANAVLTDAKGALEAALSAMTEEKDDLSDANVILTEAKSALEAALAATTAEKDQLITANAALTEAKAGLEAELSAVTEEKLRLEAELAALSAEKENLSLEKAGLEADLTSVTAEKDTLTASNSALTQEKENLTEELATLAAHMELLSAAKQQLETSLSEAEKEVASLGTQKDGLLTEQAMLNTFIGEMHSKIAGLEKLLMRGRMGDTDLKLSRTHVEATLLEGGNNRHIDFCSIADYECLAGSWEGEPVWEFVPLGGSPVSFHNSSTSEGSISIWADSPSNEEVQLEAGLYPNLLLCSWNGQTAYCFVTVRVLPNEGRMTGIGNIETRYFLTQGRSLTLKPEVLAKDWTYPTPQVRVLEYRSPSGKVYYKGSPAMAIGVRSGRITLTPKEAGIYTVYLGAAYENVKADCQVELVVLSRDVERKTRNLDPAYADDIRALLMRGDPNDADLKLDVSSVKKSFLSGGNDNPMAVCSIIGYDELAQQWEGAPRWELYALGSRSFTFHKCSAEPGTASIWLTCPDRPEETIGSGDYLNVLVCTWNGQQAYCMMEADVRFNSGRITGIHRLEDSYAVSCGQALTVSPQAACASWKRAKPQLTVISISTEDGQPAPQMTVAEASGSFTFQCAEPGTYTVVMEARHQNLYAEKAFTITVQ